MELRRTKNTATIIVFPIMKNDGTLIAGASGLDSEIDQWSDGTAPDGFSDCANEATQIGSAGQYYLSLTQSEMNADYIIIQVKSTSTGALTQTMLINTTPQRADVVAVSGDAAAADNLEAACDGTGYNLGAGSVVAASVTAAVSVSSNADITAIKARTDGLNFTGSYVQAQVKGQDNIDFGALQKASLNAATSASVSGAVGSVTAAVTVATNNDKTGYSLSQSFPSNFASLAITAGGAVTAGTVSDKTGYALSAGGVTAVQSGLSTLTAQQVWEYAARTLSSFGTLAADVWASATRTLSSFGTLAADVWASATRALTDKAGFTLHADYDAAKAAASQSSVNTIDDLLDTEVAAIKAKTDNLPVSPAATGDIPTASAVAGQVWDELIAGHLGAGSTGAKLNSLSAGGDATAANQAAIITHLTDIKGTGFVKDANSLTDLTPGSPVNVTVEHTDISTGS